MKPDFYFSYQKVQPVLTPKYHKTVSTAQDQNRTFKQSKMVPTPPVKNGADPPLHSITGGSHVSELTPLMKIISRILKFRLNNETSSKTTKPMQSDWKAQAISESTLH
ncbi:hypothetical protein OAK48_03270 [Deltaproteobacteria bacterium]|jgi:hypothetical protein|nr:hypothetical protein [Deltaproteobacteria bacterium]